MLNERDQGDPSAIWRWFGDICQELTELKKEVRRLEKQFIRQQDENYNQGYKSYKVLREKV